MSNFDYYEEFEALLNEYMPIKEVEEIRTKVLGTIVNMDRNFSYLEVEGEPKAIRVKTEELDGFEVGDEVEVLVVAKIEENDSEVLIASKRKIDVENGAEMLEKVLNEKEIVKGKVEKRVKGGYIISLYHHQGFLPNSLSEISQSKADSLVGEEIDVVVREIKKDRRGDRILLSRKEIVEARDLELMKKLEIGQEIQGEIIDVLAFGIALKFDNLRGFIHISEVDWKKTDNLKKLYNIGDVITAKIIEIDMEKRNIKLSIKQLTRNPWEIVAESYNIGSEVKGKVTRITKYGAFIEIIPGVEGLIHSSDFSWINKRINVNSFVKVGDEIRVAITEFTPEQRKIKLSLKQLSENPWENGAEKFAVGTVFKGKIVEVKSFGIFVEIEEGVDAFIHNSDFAWVGNKRFAKGEEVEFEVTELNVDEQKIKGSIKALLKSPWAIAMQNYKVGDIVEKEIKNIQDFGMFVRLEEGVDGFIPTQLISKEFVKNIRDRYKIGDNVKAEIVEIDDQRKRIKLSIKKIEIDEEKNENKELLKKYGVSSTEN